VINLRGPADQWFLGFEEGGTQLSWGEFCDALVARFGGDPLQDFEGELYKLRQTGTLADYLNEFDALSVKVPNMPEASRVKCFVAGLAEDLRVEVKYLRPTTVAMAISIAKMQEARELARQKRQGGQSSSSSLLTPYKGFSQQKSDTSWGKPFAGGDKGSREWQPRTGGEKQSRTTRVSRISEEEETRRREKGLCYKCDAKYFPGHQCKERRNANKQLCLIEGPFEEESDEDTNENCPEEIEVEQEEQLQISLHALTGGDHPDTIHLLGKCRGNKISVLLDPGP
jgi:hypothetical protein